MNDWKKIEKEANLVNRLKSIFEKTSYVFGELQKRELKKGEKLKDLFINSKVKKPQIKKKKVGK